MHFSPERRPSAREGAARPEWSVASDAEGGMWRAVRAVKYHTSQLKETNAGSIKRS